VTITGDDLKTYRRERQWRQRDLAEYLGLDQPTVSELERGVREIPSEVAEKLEALSPAPEHDDAGGSGTGGSAAPEPPPVAAPEGGGPDVPPRPTRPPRATPRVVPSDTELRALEVRVLKLIQGDDVAIMVADPGETEIRSVTQHIPGLADVVGMANEYDGQIIAANAVALSKAWVKVARENRRVRMILETLTAGGAWRDAFAATMPVVLAILLNHGLLPTLPGLMVEPTGGYDAQRDDGGGAGGGEPWSETAAGTVG
jgi:DNA-binding XRE family transcriptional regulator